MTTAEFDWHLPPTRRWDRPRFAVERDAPGGGKHVGFRYLRPDYRGKGRSEQEAEAMAVASRLYAAFVFVKDTSKLPPAARAAVAHVPPDAAELLDPRVTLAAAGGDRTAAGSRSVAHASASSSSSTTSAKRPHTDNSSSTGCHKDGDCDGDDDDDDQGQAQRPKLQESKRS